MNEVPYAKLRAELNEIIADARSAKANGLAPDAAVLQAIQVRLMLDMAESLENIQQILGSINHAMLWKS